MLAKPIPKGEIGELAKAALSRDFETLRAKLQGDVTTLGEWVGAETQIPEANKKALLNEAVTEYINKAEPALDGQTALHLAANFPTTGNSTDLGTMVFLLKEGANPNAQDNNGNTLMHHYATKCVQDLTAASREQGAAILTNYMIRILTLAFYKGNPNIANAAKQSPFGILEDSGLKYAASDTVLAYQAALRGDTPPGKVEVCVKDQMPSKQEGPHAAQVSAGRAANENKDKKADGCCVLS